MIFNNSRDTNSAAAEYVATQWEGLGARVKLTGGDYSFVIANTFSTTDLSSWDVSIGLTLGERYAEYLCEVLHRPTEA